MPAMPLRQVLVVAVLLLQPLWLSERAHAQRVRVSPHETHTFDVDGCRLTFDYGRPSKKGREIWGGLVRWGRWWMPGADESTIVTTSLPISLEGLAVPAGSHTIYMLPDEKTSKLIISNEVGQFHTVYHPERDLGRVDFSLKMLSEPVEQLAFKAEAVEGGGGALKLIWDDREYFARFTVKKGGS